MSVLVFSQLRGSAGRVLTWEPGRAAWAVGFGLRFGLHSNPDSQGIYIAYYLFIVLSVRCALMARSLVFILGLTVVCSHVRSLRQSMS